ncbi:MAG: BON domain-containing protein [Rhodopirellula sp.]|nr:BON domain-containing protein [Rhodopirellula sp.]
MNNPLHPAKDETTRVPCMLTAAWDGFANASYPALRSVTCQYDDGALILQGRVVSYYQKQLAQETVRKLDAIQQIINKIEVVDPSNSIRR